MATVSFPEVKDRNVATPSRVRLTKAVGIEDDSVFDVEPVPGSVYEEGTPLNKAFFDSLKNYIDNNVGSPDNPIPVTNGGTGANTAEGARQNLEVYSKSEIDEEFQRTSELIEPHISSRVTDIPEGVHGIYIDGEGRLWTDPDGDGQLQSNYPVDNQTLEYSDTLHVKRGGIDDEHIVDGKCLVPLTDIEEQVLVSTNMGVKWGHYSATKLWEGSVGDSSSQLAITVPNSSNYQMFIIIGTRDIDVSHQNVSLTLYTAILCTRKDSFITGASVVLGYDHSTGLFRDSTGSRSFFLAETNGDRWASAMHLKSGSFLYWYFLTSTKDSTTIGDPSTYQLTTVNSIWGLC